MSKQFWAVIAVIIIVFVGVFALTGNKSKSGSGSSSSGNQPTSHIEGNGSSTGVTLVEYGDYECPYCEAYFPTVKQVQAEYANKIYFQFRNFPLVNVHPNAFAGARAAEAAALQNKFWEMHDMLYESANWQQWSTASDPTPYFWQYASQLGLNVAQFKNDYASSKVNDLVQADISAGNKLNVQGTPSFFLDGKQVQIGASVSAFEKVINAEIAKKATAGSSSSNNPAASSPAPAASH